MMQLDTTWRNLTQLNLRIDTQMMCCFYLFIQIISNSSPALSDLMNYPAVQISSTMSKQTVENFQIHNCNYITK